MGSSVTTTPAVEETAADDPSSSGGSGGVLNGSGLVTRADFTPAALVSVAFTVVAMALVLTRSSHHIELADQSLYLLMIDEPEAAIRSASGYHVLLAPLFDLVGESIVNFRILRAILDVGVDIALGFSLVRYLRSRSNSQLFETTPAAVTVVASITLGGFSSWIYAVNGFGYDQLGAIIFSLLVTVVLWIIGGAPAASKDSLLAALAGAIFSLALIVRWTAALASLGLFAWVLIDHLGMKKARSLLGAGMVGSIGAFALIHVALIDIVTLLGGLTAGTVDVSRDSHALSVLIGNYVEFLGKGLGAGIGVLIALAFALVTVRLRSSFGPALLFVLLVSGFVLVSVNIMFGLPQFIETNTLGTYLACTCSALILLRAKENSNGGESVGLTNGLALPVLLTALPILLAAGSLLPLFLTALPLVTLWVAGLWVLVPTVAPGRMTTVAMLVGAVLLSAIPWLVWQSLERPARTPFAEAPVLIERGRFEGLLVDESTQQFLHDLEDVRLQLDPDPTVLSFWVRPAVPFALGGTGLGFPWYSLVNAPNAAAVTISGACLDDGDTPTGDVVIVTEQRDPNEFGPIRGALLDCGIDFPNDFELMTTTSAPSQNFVDGVATDVELFVYVSEGDS